MLIQLLLISSTWAIGPSKIGPLLDFSGQGIPRETLEDCRAAGTSLTAFLTKKGFKNIATDCIGTSAEIGGLVPTLLARNADRFKTEQLMNGPLPDAAACDNALKLLVASVTAGDVMEAECLKGFDTDMRGKKTPYFQPWVTTLTKVIDKTHAADNAKAAKSVEPDLRGNKAVTAAPDTTTIPAPPSADKPQAK